MNTKNFICLLASLFLLISCSDPSTEGSVVGLERYVGSYKESINSPIELQVIHEDGTLYFQPTGDPKSRATAQEEGVFQLDNAPVEIRFVENEEGHIEVFTYLEGEPSWHLRQAEVIDAEYQAVATQVRPYGLSDAVLMDDLVSARALIEQGIDVEELDTRVDVAGNNGRRPLNWAALRNNTAMIELLLDAGAGINEVNRSGLSPLHHAAEENAGDAAEMLIEKGANLNQVNRQGQTAIDVAIANNNLEVFGLLRVAMNVESCGQEICPDEGESVTPDVADFFDRLNAEIPGSLAQFNVPGAAVALIQNGKVEQTKGYGFADVANGIPVESDTGFNIGSISKTVAAWGVMTLVEQGLVSLDAPVSTYLTRWQIPESEFDADGVTIRRLLSHEAGLSLHGYPGWRPDDSLPSIEESLNGKTNGAGSVELIMEPGTRSQYSGGGYTLAQLIVEEVTGHRFEDYLREAVLRPLGMSNSDYHLSDDLMSRSSLAYDERGMPTPNPRFTAQAAAGLHTTVEDLATFAAAALTTEDGQLLGRGVLHPGTVVEMLAPTELSNHSYGLGYSASQTILGYPGHGHNGANRGWMAGFLVVPETGDGIVILTNSSNGAGVIRSVIAEWRGWVVGR